MRIALLCIALGTPGWALAQDPPDEAAAAEEAATKPAKPTDQVTLSGVLFSHYGLDLTKGSSLFNEFALDRAYLTVKATLGESLAVRFTTDVDMPEDAKVRPYVKYAYLEWKEPLPGIKVRLGAAGNGYVGYYDKLWGNRYIRKQFTDAFKIVNSSDFGLHVLGSHNDKAITWQASVVNGEGYGSPEVDAGKTGQVRVSYDPLAGKKALPITAYVSYDVGADDPTLVAAGAVGYQVGHMMAWAEVVAQMQGDTSGFGYSATLAPQVLDDVAFIARYDHWDPDSGAEADGSDTFIAGVSHNYYKKVSLALLYEGTLRQADDSSYSHGVFIRTQAGF